MGFASAVEPIESCSARAGPGAATALGAAVCFAGSRWEQQQKSVAPPAPEPKRLFQHRSLTEHFEADGFINEEEFLRILKKGVAAS